ncbi:hypothetical protein BD324DRAFT_638213 [Kockovaella imperatae]|uniref:C2H2-type domain-containing protein n=1 Tax=Kockovaella imperatae TaxID=4999 RepID=A0A1Y1U973_9TREE|nr:hypothetical protein BD324DRAFT_638213 [Kockovaella imperatae]ORX34056.1 hypothetical protein BD324DRAFT_638213 [Kockovaella imperatae]
MVSPLEKEISAAVCKWDFCTDTFASRDALQTHLTAHWKAEVPERVRVKRQKVSLGRWEAADEEQGLERLLPFKQSGDITTTTEGTTLSYVYPPSFPSQAPTLPSFLEDDNSDEIHDSTTKVGKEKARVEKTDSVSGAITASASSISNIVSSLEITTSQAADLFTQPYQPFTPPSSQYTEDVLPSPQVSFAEIYSSQISQMEQNVPGSQEATQALADDLSQLDSLEASAESDEWGCFLEPSQPGKSPMISSSPYVAPSQALPTQTRAGSPIQAETIAMSQIVKSIPMSQESPPGPSLSQMVKSPKTPSKGRSKPASPSRRGKAFVPPRSTQSPQGPKDEPISPATKNVTGKPPSSSPGRKTTASRSSTSSGPVRKRPTWIWITESPELSRKAAPSHSPASHSAAEESLSVENIIHPACGDPTKNIEIGLPPTLRENTSVFNVATPRQRSDSYSRSSLKFGMPYGQGGETATPAAVSSAITPPGSRDVGFTWAQSR